ncbi:MAG: hypothetical protein HA495_07285 [Thaumarchaeota archaeon]|nr:hypothetical protein [Nitrososphaerota archaeon]
MLAGDKKINIKDFLALFIAFLETIFLPLIVFILVAIIISFLLTLFVKSTL